MPPIVTIQIGYPFFASDPMAMTKVIQQVDQPCLGFKILAAGRMCDSKTKVEEAFKFAFEHLKATDGVIVGMYPRYHDQIQQNAQYARQFDRICKGLGPQRRYSPQIKLFINLNIHLFWARFITINPQSIDYFLSTAFGTWGFGWMQIAITI